MTVPRNAPCPCGSGRKYKHCHLGVAVEAGGDPASPPVLRRSVPILPVAAGLTVVLVGAGGFLSGWSGAAIGLGLAGFATAMIAVFRNPPPPSGNNRPSGLSFGR